MASIIVTHDAGPQRRELGPAAWVVLETLIAVGDVHATTVEAAIAVRTLAAESGLGVDATVSALGRPRAAGIATQDQSRSSGRFGSGRWTIDLAGVRGVRVVDPTSDRTDAPCPDEPGTDHPCPVNEADGSATAVTETADASTAATPPQRTTRQRRSARLSLPPSLFEI